MKNVVSNIQVLRAVAAQSVATYHLQPMINASFGTDLKLPVGAVGVDIFFVISGFIMFYTNRYNDRAAHDFLANRFIRIVPLYWLATGCIATLFILGFHPNGLHYLTPEIFVRSLIFIRSDFPDGRTDLVLSLGWTLIYEIFFYILFAATLATSSLKLRLLIINLLFVVAVTVRFAFETFSGTAPFLCSSILFEFGFGCGLATLYLNWNPTPSRRLLIVATATLVFGIALSIQGATFHQERLDELRVLYFGIPALLIVSAALLYERIGRRITNRSALLLGAASYSLYLFHPILLQSTVKFTAHLLPSNSSISPILAALLASVVAIAASIIIYLQIEQRILRGGHKFAAKLHRKRAIPVSLANTPQNRQLSIAASPTTSTLPDLDSRPPPSIAMVENTEQSSDTTQPK
ncbi:acyltransferase [Rhodopseudomonas palustris]|uniref:acyltransferase family protein n=1 Tax=Rhodopseudomonas palustris TaxID=1076 RepID=UPI0022F07DB6|nr:acyltransferase [Rhodopseudomonas palustris]WBU32118.1 acyltransferase [Rhodopseudomonas palustris]